MFWGFGTELGDGNDLIVNAGGILRMGDEPTRFVKQTITKKIKQQG
jgi:hypothetical protein